MNNVADTRAGDARHGGRQSHVEERRHGQIRQWVFSIVYSMQNYEKDSVPDKSMIPVPMRLQLNTPVIDEQTLVLQLVFIT